MLDWLLGVMSLASLAISYQWVTNHSLRGKRVGETVGSTESSSIVTGHIAYDVNSSIIKWTKLTPTHTNGLLWCLNYVYHYMVAKVFVDEMLLNMVNLMTTLLSFIVFCRTMYQQLKPCSVKLRYDPEDILLQTRSYWEFILAGMVLVQLFLR